MSELKQIAPVSQDQPDGTSCAHCGLHVPDSLMSASYNSGRGSEAEVIFCCAGCAFVYDSLHSLGLQRFYGIREQYGEFDASPATQSISDFDYLDDERFAALHTKSSSRGFVEVHLYLEGVHCPACVWLVERIPHILTGVYVSRLNFIKKLVSLEFDPTVVSLSEIAKTLASLGYYPHPATEERRNRLARKSNRQLLLRLGVAAVAAANTMLFATSMYQGDFSGIEERFQRLFQWASLLIATPAVIYSATPFYQAALAGLRRRVVHIDLPLALGILGGYCISVINTLTGTREVYFDSICALIFLLLVGRYVQSRAIAKIRDSSNTASGILPHRVWKLVDGQIREAFSASLSVGDIVHVPRDERIPADGTLISEEAFVDQSLLTGESKAVRKEAGDDVYAGTRNGASDIRVSVTSLGDETRIGSLIQPLAASSSEGVVLGASASAYVDAISRYFVVCVCLLACLAFYLGTLADFDEGVSRALALLVVSCPCALALAYPLSCSVAIARAARSGIFVYKNTLLEKILNCHTVFFDKTGTVTRGEMSLEYSWFAEAEKGLSRYIGALERQSQHPIALSLQKTMSEAAITDEVFAETQSFIGKGLSGLCKSGERWRIGSEAWVREEGVVIEGSALSAVHECRELALTTVLLCRGSSCLAVLGLGDSLKPGVAESLASLEKRELRPGLLSGDISPVVHAVAEQLGLDAGMAFGDCSPEDKAEKIADFQPGVIMVGDGVNDVKALAVAEVALGIHGGAEACLQSADAYIADEDISGVPALMGIADRWRRTFRACLLFSLSYNALASLCAVLGYVSPLVAAIIMPISSLTVVLIAQTGRRG